MKSRYRSLLLAASATISVALLCTAKADPIDLTLTEISPTEIIVTGTGDLAGFSAPPNGNSHILGVSDPFGATQPTGYENAGVLTSSDMTFNSQAMNFAYTASAAYNVTPTGLPTIYFGTESGQSLTTDAETGFTGSETWTLTDGSTFAPIGTTGTVYWGIPGGENVGTYQIVGTSSVPDNSFSALMLGMGLTCLLGLRRKFSWV